MRQSGPMETGVTERMPSYDGESKCRILTSVFFSVDRFMLTSAPNIIWSLCVSSITCAPPLTTRLISSIRADCAAGCMWASGFSIITRPPGTVERSPTMIGSTYETPNPVLSAVTDPLSPFVLG